MKIGKIEISNELIQNYKMLSPLFAVFVPIHIEQAGRSLIYTGYSERFEDVGECIIPTYSASISQNMECEIKRV